LTGVALFLARELCILFAESLGLLREFSQIIKSSSVFSKKRNILIFVFNERNLKKFYQNSFCKILKEEFQIFNKKYLAEKFSYKTLVSNL